MLMGLMWGLIAANRNYRKRRGQMAGVGPPPEPAIVAGPAA
jgi:hypothetical protein